MTSTPPCQALIVDPLPAFADGLAAALTTAGFTVVHRDDPVSWLGATDFAVALVDIDDPIGAAMLAKLTRHPNPATLVALIDDTSVDRYAQALTDGADAVAPRNAPPEDIAAITRYATGGQLLLPLEVAQQLIHANQTNRPHSLEPDEINWLRALAAGATVVTVAQDAVMSERTMHRRLENLYTRLGVDNRDQALIRAAELGLLSDT